MKQPVQGSVTVVGAGGIGATIGLALAAGGAVVEFVEVDTRRIDRGRRAGVSIRAFDDWAPKPGETIILATKCYDNGAVLARLPAGAALVPIQNGFDPGLENAALAGEGIASFVAACRPDHFAPAITRPGDLHIGSGDGRPLDGTICDLFQRLTGSDRFRLKFVSKILPYKHAKLMYNAAISPLAAAAGIDNGDLLRDPNARRLFFALLQENYAILDAAGVELGQIGPFPPRTVARILRSRWIARILAKFFEPSLRGTYCSMAGEIETGRTEIDNYNGHLLRLAEGRVPAPLNRAVYELVKRMESNRSKPDRAVLAALLKA